MFLFWEKALSHRLGLVCSSHWEPVVVQNFLSLAPLLQALPAKGWIPAGTAAFPLWDVLVQQQRLRAVGNQRRYHEWWDNARVEQRQLQLRFSSCRGWFSQKHLLWVPVLLLFASSWKLTRIPICKACRELGSFLLFAVTRSGLSTTRNKPVNRTLKILQAPSSCSYSISQEVW